MRSALSSRLTQLFLGVILVGTVAVMVHPAPALGGGSTATRPTTVPQIAAYRWVIKPQNVDAFGQWLGRPDVWGEDFSGPESWDNVDSPGWLLKPWGKWVAARPGRKLIFGVPVLTGPWDRSGPTQGSLDKKIPVSLQAGARGDYSRHFEALAKNLVADGLGESILRLGWEFNGGWYTWRAGETPEAFADYWRQIVKTMRGVQGAEKLTFCWNPTLWQQQFPAEKAWPGDEFVDYVGVDVYDESWNKETYPWPANTPPAEIRRRQEKVWKELHYWGDHGLLFWSKFAADHKKPLAIPEWGVSDREGGHGGLDNPYFIQQMHAFINDPKNNVAFHCYFDVEAPDGKHQLSPGPDGKHVTLFPEAAKVFRERFGPAR